MIICNLIGEWVGWIRSGRYLFVSQPNRNEPTQRSWWFICGSRTGELIEWSKSTSSTDRVHNTSKYITTCTNRRLGLVEKANMTLVRVLRPVNLLLIKKTWWRLELWSAPFQLAWKPSRNKTCVLDANLAISPSLVHRKSLSVSVSYSSKSSSEFARNTILHRWFYTQNEKDHNSNSSSVQDAMQSIRSLDGAIKKINKLTLFFVCFNSLREERRRYRRRSTSGTTKRRPSWTDLKRSLHMNCSYFCLKLSRNVNKCCDKCAIFPGGGETTKILHLNWMVQVSGWRFYSTEFFWRPCSLSEMFGNQNWFDFDRSFYNAVIVVYDDTKVLQIMTCAVIPLALILCSFLKQ